MRKLKELCAKRFNRPLSWMPPRIPEVRSLKTNARQRYKRKSGSKSPLFNRGTLLYNFGYLNGAKWFVKKYFYRVSSRRGSLDTLIVSKNIYILGLGKPLFLAARDE
jgi:hypothetical protein